MRVWTTTWIVTAFFSVGGLTLGSAADGIGHARSSEQAGQRPGAGVWANYDFVPGERVLFVEDFAQDTVGDFPRRMTLVSGTWEVVEKDGRRMLSHTGPRHAAVNIALAEPLPERFTIELDVHFPHANQQLIVSTEENSRTPMGNVFQVARNGTGIAPGSRSKLSSTTRTLGTIETELTPVRIMVDGRHAKVFVNEQRVANAPNAEFVRGRIVQLRNSYFADAANPMFIGSIRIAAGGRDLYDALSREGRAITRGILFATGSDEIRPESTPTLKEIGGLLVAHPDLRLVIEGHTDDVGDAAANLALSSRRAAAVKSFLVAEFSIDAARLETVGMGEVRPVGDNKTAEGREQNRRVELVRKGG